MKKIVLAATFGCLSTMAAVAADLPSRRAPPVYIPPAPPTFSWTGPYVGVNAGYAFNGDHTFTTSGNTPGQIADIATGLRPTSIRDRSNGFTGGAQIGYNYEFSGGSFLGSGIVVGVEADAAYVGPGSNSTYTSGAFVSRFASRTDYVGTVRGRLGYAFDRVLVFGTGGFAYGNVRDNETFANAAGVNTFAGSRNAMRTGYAYGGGVEYAIPTSSFLNVFNSSAVTLKAEFIHYDLGTSAVLVGGVVNPANSFTSQIRTQGNLARAGINYKFDLFGAPAPVVARY